MPPKGKGRGGGAQPQSQAGPRALSPDVNVRNLNLAEILAAEAGMEEVEFVSMVFGRAAMIRNDDLKVSNFVAPQFFERYSALQLFTKQAREQDPELRTMRKL